MALLAAALAAAIVMAWHYREEATAAHRQLESVQRACPGRDYVPPAVHQHGRAAWSAAVVGRGDGLRGPLVLRLARVVVTVRITGGRPGVRYDLFGGDCAGDAPVHDWAAGSTDAHGSAQLTGRPWTVSVSHRYFLALSSPGTDHPGPAVHGYFGRVHGLAPVRGGIAPCVP